MPTEDFLSVPGLDKTLRINKDCQKPFYAVFVEELGQNKFMTTEMRNKIFNRWAKITPLIPLQNLRQHLYNIEKKYYAAMTSWQQPALINKITDQSMALQEDIHEADDESARLIIKKAEAINNLNRTIASVNKLDAAPLQATFIINTNINEDEMAMEMNTIDIIPEED